MKLLLPHRFKTIGAIIAPLGLALWLTMQFGYITKVLIYISGEPLTTSPYHVINVAIAVISFFSFLSGIYFAAFSKEKIEDEMVQKTRLDSFQFAALIQIIIFIGFLFMFFAGDPGESGLMQFFMILVCIFWLSFIGRFNYVLHVKLRQ